MKTPQRRPDQGRSFWALFLPLENKDFLVPDEEVLYDRRYHSAILLQPAFELMAALTLVVWINLNVSLTRTTMADLMVIAAMWIIVRLGLKVHRSRRRTIIIFAVMLLLGYALRNDRDTIARLIVGGFAVRFIGRWLRWAFYRRLLITNRRVIEIDGLVGSSVASMPLFRVTDALLHRSPLAELLGYALFRIESAGQDQALGRINFLDDADYFHSLLIQLSTTAKTDLMPTNGDLDLGTAADRLL